MTKSVRVAVDGGVSRPSRLDGFVELVCDRRLHGFERVVRDARRPEPARVDEQRVACLPLLDLVGRSVALRVAFVVAVPAVGGRLDDDGTPARAVASTTRVIAAAVATTSLPSTATYSTP